MMSNCGRPHPFAHFAKEPALSAVEGGGIPLPGGQRERARLQPCRKAPPFTRPHMTANPNHQLGRESHRCLEAALDSPPAQEYISLASAVGSP